MLSTGVDIPALEFIVFLRPVKSRILWEQMLGRGTRLCPDIDKSKFVVFDCFDGTLIQYFRNVSSFDIEPPADEPIRRRIQEAIENPRDAVPFEIRFAWNHIEPDLIWLKECAQLIKFNLTDGIVFVVVAFCAIHGQTKKGLCDVLYGFLKPS